MSQYKELEAVLDEYVRPLLNTHGGNMQVLSFEDGVVRFKLTGQCSGCPAADLTTEELIQTTLADRMPEVTEAVLVQQVSDELVDQARAILRDHHA